MDSFFMFLGMAAGAVIAISAVIASMKEW